MNQNNGYDLAIAGAGASALAAALTLKRERPEASIIIFEKKEQAATKLAATGNGRCNLSNQACKNTDEVFEFFAKSGIATRRDVEGRYYPCSEDARQLASLLTEEARALGITIMLSSEVKKVEACQDGGFLLLVQENSKSRGAGEYFARRVLIATGGKSYPGMGTTGDGYVLARKLGHSLTPLAPGLTAVCTDMPEIKKLKGVRAKAEVKLCESGKEIERQAGEIQFRDDSLSGICIMNLSNHIKPKKRQDPGAQDGLSFAGYELALDFVPEYDGARLEAHIGSMTCMKSLAICDALKSLVKGPLGEAIASRAGFCEDERLSELSGEDIKKLAGVLKDFRVPVTGLKGWKEAQITCGGVSLDEICITSMQSKLLAGLYFSGEVIDYAGPCGGFNLHNAWLTGIRAGKAVAGQMEQQKNV